MIIGWRVQLWVWLCWLSVTLESISYDNWKLCKNDPQLFCDYIHWPQTFSELMFRESHKRRSLLTQQQVNNILWNHSLTKQNIRKCRQADFTFRYILIDFCVKRLSYKCVFIVSKIDTIFIGSLKWGKILLIWIIIAFWAFNIFMDCNWGSYSWKRIVN